MSDHRSVPTGTTARRQALRTPRRRAKRFGLVVTSVLVIAELFPGAAATHRAMKNSVQAASAKLLPQTAHAALQAEQTT